jgi:hypothetical protein
MYKTSTENAHITSGVRSQYYGTAATSTILLLLIIYSLSHPFRNVPDNVMVTLQPFCPISYTGVHGVPIGRPLSADRVVTLHTLIDRDHASF